MKKRIFTFRHRLENGFGNAPGLFRKFAFLCAKIRLNVGSC